MQERHWMTIPVNDFEALNERVRLAESGQRTAFYLTALERIRQEGGKVCSEFEFCHHVACMSSYAAWSIADAALHGETPESANAKAIAQRRQEERER